MSSVEFALVAPAFLMMMMFLMDGARAVWTYQTLQEIASGSARRAAVIPQADCGSTGEGIVDSFVATRSAKSQVSLAASAVTLTCNPAPAECHNMGGMVRVVVSTPYKGATTKLLPSSLTNLQVTSCFPRMA